MRNKFLPMLMIVMLFGGSQFGAAPLFGAALTDLNSSLEKAIADQSKIKDEQTRQLQELTNAISGLSSSFENTKSQLSEKNTALSSASENIRTLKMQVSKLNQEIEPLSRRAKKGDMVDGLQKQLETLRTELETEKAKTTQLTQLQSESDKILARSKTLERELNASREEAKAASLDKVNKIRELEVERERLALEKQKELDALKQTLQTQHTDLLEKAKQQATAEADNRYRSLTDQQKKEFEVQAETLRKQLADVTTKTQQEAKKQTDELERLNAELQSNKDAVKQAQERITQARQEAELAARSQQKTEDDALLQQKLAELEKAQKDLQTALALKQQAEQEREAANKKADQTLADMQKQSALLAQQSRDARLQTARGLLQKKIETYANLRAQIKAQNDAKKQLAVKRYNITPELEKVKSAVDHVVRVRTESSNTAAISAGTKKHIRGPDMSKMTGRDAPIIGYPR